MSLLASALTKVDPLSLILTDPGGARQWVTTAICGTWPAVSQLPAWYDFIKSPLFDPAGGVVDKLGTPFVPTPAGGHGAQGWSRDETACGARLGARPLTTPSTVASLPVGRR